MNWNPSSPLELWKTTEVKTENVLRFKETSLLNIVSLGQPSKMQSTKIKKSTDTKAYIISIILMKKITILISFYNYGNWEKRYVYLVHTYIYRIYIIYIQIHFIIEMCNYSSSQWSPREKGVTFSCCQLDGWLRRCKESPHSWKSASFVWW